MDSNSSGSGLANKLSGYMPWSIFSKRPSPVPQMGHGKTQMEPNAGKISTACSSSPGGTPKDCPLEREDLGRNTWSLLHTMAAYLPDNPSNQDKKDIKQFMDTLGKFYPCEVCANELSSHLKQNPPDVRTRKDFCQWMCRLHNSVNERLGKEPFDCSQVDERWKDGWKDGRCD